MQPAAQKYQTEIIEKLNQFDEVEVKEILDFINFLAKERKKKQYSEAFEGLQKEFQEKMTVQDALNELEEYRRGK
jgi:phage-related tail protein